MQTFKSIFIECEKEIEITRECKKKEDCLSCTASSEYGLQKVFPCWKAINKNPVDSWVTFGEPVGAWIKISLNTTYVVTRIELRHRSKPSAEHERFKGIKIEFSNGAAIEHILQNDLELNDVPLASTHVTDFVKITSTSHYGKENSNNGFSEIRIFGCVQGTKRSLELIPYHLKLKICHILIS